MPIAITRIIDTNRKYTLKNRGTGSQCMS